MPLLRQSLYSQNVNLYLAPTADARDTWLPLMRTVASEGRCVVLSANQCIKESDLPDWITGQSKEESALSQARLRVNGQNSSPPRFRRKSTITDDGHEIVFPNLQSRDESPAVSGTHSVDGSARSSPPRLRRKSTITDEGHEIVLPGIKEASESLERVQKASEPSTSTYATRGGSCIISPLGDVLAGPLWDDDDGLLTVDVDFDDCLRGRLDLDVGGSYSRYVLLSVPVCSQLTECCRNDSFKLTVEGLDLSPPP